MNETDLKESLKVNTIFQTFKYKLIYVFRINDENHEGVLKVGDATVDTNLPKEELTANCEELNMAARKRIDTYTSTAGIVYELLHTELAVDNNNVAFRDHKVHDVLTNSGIENKYFDTNRSQDEWFKTDLMTVRKAIIAVKEGKESLTRNQITNNRNPIKFRFEQRDAIDTTLKQFKKSNKMLWNAKMRFGKTLTALQVVKESKFKRTIIVTHRPVVEVGWFEDFEKIFYDTDNYIVGSKNKQSIESLERSGNNYVYFASIQDLRGSETVGGKFDKNDEIFGIDWDCVIIDEAHEGTKTNLGKSVLKELIKEDRKDHATKVLQLSGTPFNLIADFDEREIYTWDYIMEQRAKEDWTRNHYLDSNPYEELPKLNIFTYDLKNIIKGYEEFEDKAFNFKEFFRTWTGDVEVDKRRVPEGVNIGDFVHEDRVNEFLNLLVKKDTNSNYPYSTDEYRDYFRHSLWMVPGVKEAKALSKLLKKHPVFGNGVFKIVNVAGDGDEEEKAEEALKKVNDAIGENPDETYTITLSCGRLTTGVTVKAWTAVFMLSGTYSTGAASYLQTIFRVQTPAQIGGKIKTDCYVFDFAPDRTLKMVAEAGNLSTKPGNGGGDRILMGQFLNFCPVIAVEGSTMKPYDVDGMLQQLKKSYAERVVRNGFDDVKIYNNNLLQLDGLELEMFKELEGIIGASKQTKKVNEIDINKQGLTNEEYSLIEKQEKKAKRELTEEELENRERQKQKLTAISILRGISIRIPLMIYGANIPFEEEVTLDNFTEIVDDKSWEEFMPKGVTKEKFKEVSKYYDADIFIESGRQIRNKLKATEELSITQRVMRIAEIFSSFKNPDKETVLTPWRVVNMHMGDCIGGYNFFDVNYNDTLLTPRLMLNGEVTHDTLINSEAKILELNSKTGLYPLYVAYSIYRQKLLNVNKKNITEEDIAEELWKETLKENIFVVCRTPMAKCITERTLRGFKNYSTNILYYENLIEELQDNQEKFVQRVQKSKTWKREEDKIMKFDAIVGNPPYQSNDGGGTGDSATPIYNLFIQAAKKVNPKYISLICPSRWMKGGKGLDKFREEMINDTRIRKIYDYQDYKVCFPTANIDGGICYFLWDKDNKGMVKYKYYLLNGKVQESERYLKTSFSDTVIRDVRQIPILEKIHEKKGKKLSDIVSYRNHYGFASDFFNNFEKYKIEKKSSNDDNVVQIHGIKGKKGGSKRVSTYIDEKNVTKNEQDIDKYKLFFSKAYTTTATVPPEIILGEPKTICTETFLQIGPFESKIEAENCLKYIRTKFFRALLYFNRHSLNISKNSFDYIPMQDFTENSDIDWKLEIQEINKQLYKKYQLSAKDIAYIEENIEEM